MKFLNTVPYTCVYVGALVIFCLGVMIGRYSGSGGLKAEVPPSMDAEMSEDLFTAEHRSFLSQQALLKLENECLARPQSLQLTVANAVND